VEPSAKKSEAVVSAVVDDRPPWEPQIQPVEQVVVAVTESVVEQAAEPATEFMTQPSAQSAVAEPLEQYREAASQQAQNSVEPAAPAPIPLADFAPENWIQLRRQLSIGASLGEIASHCLYLGRNGQQLNFLIDSDHNSLYDDPHQQQFSEALSAYFQQPVTVEITLGVAEKETPRAATTREKAERLVEAVESLNQDPAVVKFKQLFDGALDEGSVRPID